VHFEPSDILVVGGRKEVKKSAIPSRFCNCPVDDIQDCKKLQLGKRKKEEIHMRNVKPRLEALENSSIYIEHSYNKSMQRLLENCLPLKEISQNIVEHSYSQISKSKKRKYDNNNNEKNDNEHDNNNNNNNENSSMNHISRSKRTYMPNVKTTVNNLQIHIKNTTCEKSNKKCTEIITKLSKKQVCAMKHEINCPFRTDPLPIYTITKTISIRELSTLPINEIKSSKNNCLQSNINIIEHVTKTSGNRLKSLEQLHNDKKVQKKCPKKDKHKIQKEDKKSNYWMQELKKVSEENIDLKKQIKILNNCLQKTELFFANDQLQVLRTGTSRGIKWSEDTILKGLSLRFTCGTRGYNYLRKIMAPLPSVRSYKEVQNILNLTQDF